MRSMGRVGVRRTSRARSLLFMDSFSFACASSHIPFETRRMLKFEGKKQLKSQFYIVKETLSRNALNYCIRHTSADNLTLIK